MIKISLVTLEIVFAVVWVLIRAIVWMRQKKIFWEREAVLLFMYLNLAVVLRYTFFPIALVYGEVQPLIINTDEIFPIKLNLIPFVNMFDYENSRDLLLNVIGNLMLFIPGGIVLPVVYKRLNSFWKVTAAGMGISLCIEIIQLPFSSRTTDVDDLILNTIGVMIGYGIYIICRKVMKHNQKSSTVDQ